MAAVNLLRSSEINCDGAGAISSEIVSAISSATRC